MGQGLSNNRGTRAVALALPAALALAAFGAAASSGDQATPAAGDGFQAREERGLDAASFLTAHQATITGDIEGAAGGYTAALAADPASGRLLERTFQSLYLSGRIVDADAIAATLDRMGEPPAQGSEPAAAIAAAGGDWAGVRVLARHMLGSPEGYALGVVLEAWSLAFQGRGDEALSTLADIQLDEQPPEMLFTQTALMLEHLGRGAVAAEAARLAISRNPSDPDTLILMSGILARSGAANQARRRLGRQTGGTYAWDRIAASLADPAAPLRRAPDQRRLLANAVLDVGLLKGSAFPGTMTRFRLARFLDPDDDRTRFHLGSLLHQAGEAGVALALHDSIAPGSPWHQPARIRSAIHHSRSPGGKELASTIYSDLIEANPGNPLLHRLRGDNARRHDRFEEALDDYARAIDLGGDRGRLEYYRGIAFDLLERDAEAEAAFRRSLGHDGGNAYALNYLGYWLLEHGGDAAEALSLIRRAVEVQPRNGFFMDSLGWGYYRLGQYSEALVLLERAVILEPADATIIDHLGDAYEKNGRLREAVYEWERALYYADGEVDPEAIRAKIDDARSRLGQ